MGTIARRRDDRNTPDMYALPPNDRQQRFLEATEAYRDALFDFAAGRISRAELLARHQAARLACRRRAVHGMPHADV